MFVTRRSQQHRSTGTVGLPRSVAEYLAAAGIVKICIVRNADGTCGFRIITNVGKHGEDSVSAHWVANNAAATAVVRSAASIAGMRPTEQAALDGLFRAATKHSVRLTAHEAVIARAMKAAARLDASLKAAAIGGRLKHFHAEYRRRRIEAGAHGKPFMSFTMAERRLWRAIVARLLHDGVAADLFDEVFDA